MTVKVLDIDTFKAIMTQVAEELDSYASNYDHVNSDIRDAVRVVGGIIENIDWDYYAKTEDEKKKDGDMV